MGQKLDLSTIDPLRYQEPPRTTVTDKDEWLTVKMRYKDPDSERSELVQAALAGTARPLEDTSDDFRFAAAVAQFGMLLRNSEYKANASYERVREAARGARGPDPHGHRGEFLKLVDVAEQLTGK